MITKKYYKIAHEGIVTATKTKEIDKRQALELIEEYIDTAANEYYDKYISPLSDEEDNDIVCKAYEKAYEEAIDDFERLGYFDIGDFNIKIQQLYEVDLTYFEDGHTEAIDNIYADIDYTAEEFKSDCKKNADDDYLEWIEQGEVKLIKIED